MRYLFYVVHLLIIQKISIIAMLFSGTLSIYHIFLVTLKQLYTTKYNIKYENVHNLLYI